MKISSHFSPCVCGHSAPVAQGQASEEMAGVSCRKQSTQKPRDGYTGPGLLRLHSFHSNGISPWSQGCAWRGCSWEQADFPVRRELTDSCTSQHLRVSSWGFWKATFLKTGSICSSRSPAAKAGKTASTHLNAQGAVQSHGRQSSGLEVLFPYPSTLLEGTQRPRGRSEQMGLGDGPTHNFFGSGQDKLGGHH